MKTLTFCVFTLLFNALPTICTVFSCDFVLVLYLDEISKQSGLPGWVINTGTNPEVPKVEAKLFSLMNTCLGIKSENAPEKSTFSIAINYNDYSQQVNEYLREAKDCLNDYTKKYSHSKFLPCQSYGVLCKMASNEKGEKSDFFFTIVHFNKSNNLTVFTWFDPNTTKFNVLDTAVEYHRKSLLNVFDLGQLNETVPTSIKYFSNPSKHILFVVSEFTNLNLQYISLIEDKLGKANSIIPSYIFVCTYGQKDHQLNDTAYLRYPGESRSDVHDDLKKVIGLKKSLKETGVVLSWAESPSCTKCKDDVENVSLTQTIYSDLGTFFANIEPNLDSNSKLQESLKVLLANIRTDVVKGYEPIKFRTMVGFHRLKSTLCVCTILKDDQKANFNNLATAHAASLYKLFGKTITHNYSSYNNSKNTHAWSYFEHFMAAFSKFINKTFPNILHFTAILKSDQKISSVNLNDHSKKFINDEDAIIEVNKFNLNLSTNQVKNINDQFTNKWPLDNINNIKEEDIKNHVRQWNAYAIREDKQEFNAFFNKVVIITCVKTVFDSNTNMDVKSAALDHMANLHTMLQFDTIKNMLIGWRYEKSYNFFESCHQIYWKTV